MIRKPFLFSLGLMLALGAAACGGDDEAEQAAEGESAPVVVPPMDTLQVDPAVTQGAVMMDTSNAGALMQPAVIAPGAIDTVAPDTAR